MPEREWNYTDDTLMAMSIFSVLRQYGYIDQPTLARSFAERYESTRGYGPAMHRLLWEIKCGEDWAERAQSQFGGQGSFGNGSAMRVAPVGAFFANDVDAAVEQVARSSVVTHTHNCWRYRRVVHRCGRDSAGMVGHERAFASVAPRREVAR